MVMDGTPLYNILSNGKKIKLQEKVCAFTHKKLIFNLGKVMSIFNTFN